MAKRKTTSKVKVSKKAPKATTGIDKNTYKDREKKGAKKPGAFKKGNKLWEFRSDHGRDTLFKTPRLLWEEAMEYFAWCDRNPLYKNQLTKDEDGVPTVEKVDVGRPYTLTGLCFYLRCSENYFRNCRTDTASDDFLAVVDAIEQVIKTQQISGAMNSLFNANIVSRLQGLVDRKDITSDGTVLQPPAINVYNTGPKLAGNEDDVVD